MSVSPLVQRLFGVDSFPTSKDPPHAIPCPAQLSPDAQPGIDEQLGCAGPPNTASNSSSRSSTRHPSSSQETQPRNQPDANAHFSELSSLVRETASAGDSLAENLAAKVELVYAIRELARLEGKMQVEREDGMRIGKLEEVVQERNSSRARLDQLSETHSKICMKPEQTERSLQQKLSVAHAALEAKREVHTTCSAQLDTALSAIAKLQEKILKLEQNEAELRAMSNELQQSKTSEQYLRARVQDLSSELSRSLQTACLQRKRADTMIDEPRKAKVDLQQELEMTVKAFGDARTQDEHCIAALTVQVKEKDVEREQTLLRFQQMEVVCRRQERMIEKLESNKQGRGRDLKEAQAKQQTEADSKREIQEELIEKSHEYLDYSETIANLQAEVERLCAMNKELKGLVKYAEEQSQRVSEQLKDECVVRQDLEQEQARLRDRLAQFETRNSRLLDDVQVETQKVQELKSELGATVELMLVKEESIALLQEDNVQLRDDANKERLLFEQQHESMQKQLNTRENEAQLLAQDNSKLREQCEQNEQIIVNHGRCIKYLEAEINQLATQLEHSQSRSSAMEALMSVKEEALKVLNEEVCFQHVHQLCARSGCYIGCFQQRPWNGARG
jgi:chromosome segregation ATPase